MSGSLLSTLGRVGSIASGITSAVSAVGAVTGLGFGSAGPVSLGDFVFDGFEVPESIAFGGGQKLVVFQMPGGERVMDAMGREDMTLCWSGHFLGPDAADRARRLDAMRVASGELPLSWGGFSYAVVISRVECEYRQAGHVPYKIECTVLRDEYAAAPADPGLDVAVQGGLASAAKYLADGVGRIAASATGVLSAATRIVAPLAGRVPFLSDALGYLTTAQGVAAGAGSLAANLGAASAVMGGLQSASGSITAGLASYGAAVARWGAFPSAGGAGLAHDVAQVALSGDAMACLHAAQGEVGRAAANLGAVLAPAAGPAPGGGFIVPSVGISTTYPNGPEFVTP